MRYLKIFLLQFQEVITDRSRIIVWVLLAGISPLIMVLFWRGAVAIAGWTTQEITSYYFLAIVASVLIMCHQEEHIARIDIQEGGLTAYLLKPFSYIQLLFFNEVSYRLIQGVIGMILFGCFFVLFPRLFTLTQSFEVMLLSVLLLFGAFFLSFIFKTCVGLLAFWMTETRGMFEAVNVLITILGGVLMPVAFFPTWLEHIASVSPFPYMIYFPVIAFTGRLSIVELWHVLAVQGLWVILFYAFYLFLWQAGLKKYTAVGQ